MKDEEDLMHDMENYFSGNWTGCRFSLLPYWCPPPACSVICWLWVLFWVKGKEVEPIVRKAQVPAASLVTSLGNEKPDRYLEMAGPPRL